MLILLAKPIALLSNRIPYFDFHIIFATENAWSHMLYFDQISLFDALPYYVCHVTQAAPSVAKIECHYVCLLDVVFKCIACFAASYRHKSTAWCILICLYSSYRKCSIKTIELVGVFTKYTHCWASTINRGFLWLWGIWCAFKLRALVVLYILCYQFVDCWACETSKRR